MPLRSYDFKDWCILSYSIPLDPICWFSTVIFRCKSGSLTPRLLCPFTFAFLFLILAVTPVTQQHMDIPDTYIIYIHMYMYMYIICIYVYLICMCAPVYIGILYVILYICMCVYTCIASKGNGAVAPCFCSFGVTSRLFRPFPTVQNGLLVVPTFVNHRYHGW